MTARTYKKTQSWICKIVFRSLAILFALAAVMVPIGLDTKESTWPLLVPVLLQAGAGVVWSLIDLIFLCVRRSSKPMISIFIDIIFAIVFVAVGGFFANITFTTVDPGPVRMALFIDVPIYIVAGIFHFVLFVLAVRTHRQNRRERKIRYRPDSYAMYNGTAESLIPLKDRPIANGHSAF